MGLSGSFGPRLFFLLLVLSSLFLVPVRVYAVGVTPPFGSIVMLPGEHASFEITVTGNASVYTRVVQAVGGSGCIVAVEPSRFVVEGSRRVAIGVECSRPGSYAYRIFFHEEPRGGRGVVVQPAVVFKLAVLVRGVRVDVWRTNESLTLMVMGYGVRVESARLTVYVNGVARFDSTVPVPSRHVLSYDELGLGVGVHNVTVVVSADGVPGDRVVLRVSRLVGVASVDFTVSSPGLVFGLPGSLVEYMVRAVTMGNASCRISYAAMYGDSLFTGVEESGPGGVVERSLNVHVDPWSLFPYSADVVVRLKYTCGSSSGELIRRASALVIPLGFLLVVGVSAVVLSYLVYRFYARRGAGGG